MEGSFAGLAVAFASLIGLGYLLDAKIKERNLLVSSEMNNNSNEQQVTAETSQKDERSQLAKDIMLQNGNDADKAVMFDELIYKPDEEQGYNVFLFFREQDRKFIYEELETRKIPKGKTTLFDPPCLMLLEIPTLELVKDLPVLYQLFPTKIPFQMVE